MVKNKPPAEKKQTKKRWPAILAIVLGVAALGAGGVRLAMRRAPLVSMPDQQSAKVLIRNVRVIDVVAGSALESVDVLLEGSEIKRIDKGLSEADAAVVIDGSGMSLIPGFIDIHCHLLASSSPSWRLAIPDTDEHLEQLLYSGVTRALDPASMVPDIFELRQEVNTGARLGPTIYAAGPMFTAPNGHPIPALKAVVPWFLVDRMIKGMVREVDSAEQATEALNALLPSKPDFVKFGLDHLPLDAPRLDPAVAAALAAEAKKHGVRTLAHIGSTKDALEAARAGAAAWVHGVYKERIPDEQLAELASFKIPMAPTLVVFQSYGMVGRGRFPSTELEREIAPADLLDSRVNAPDDYEWDPALRKFTQLLADQQENALANVRRLAKAGVVIMVGTDAQAGVVHGASFHREIALLAKAGLTPLQVLQAATLNNARFLADQTDPPFGIVAVGKRADLVLVRGNPLEDVAALSAIEHVILGGVPMARHPLQR
jgi:imidazolonepropionase-like amidohydrolase